MTMCGRFFVCVAWLLAAICRADAPVAIGTFQVDVTPPLGTPLCDGLVMPGKEVVDPLTARGIVIVGAQRPIVLCAVDWVGIGNTGYDAWRAALAEAAGTTPDRVAVHCLHQHNAPGCDFAAADLLSEHKLAGAMFDVPFARAAIDRVGQAVRSATRSAQPVTHVGTGRGRVEQVASNRRVLGPDGQVKYVRTSATKLKAARDEPEGTIDPDVRLLSFWSGERPVASITYYATHPQSYYAQGGISGDFPGMARAMRESAVPGIAHVHFNGASGNVTAGKYNDGNPANRPILAARLAEGMKRAWESTSRVPLAAGDVAWRVVSVHLPPSERVRDEAARLAEVDDQTLDLKLRIRSARDVTFGRLLAAGRPTPLTRLVVGPADVVHMPGELFVEYQLAAQQIRPDRFVCLAAYGDYGPGYIGTQVSYTQGGYETGPVSRVAPEVEGVLQEGLRQLLK